MPSNRILFFVHVSCMQWRNQDFFQGGQKISYFPKISRFQKPLYKIVDEGQEGFVLVTYQLPEGKHVKCKFKDIQRLNKLMVRLANFSQPLTLGKP